MRQRGSSCWRWPSESVLSISWARTVVRSCQSDLSGQSGLSTLRFSWDNNHNNHNNIVTAFRDTGYVSHCRAIPC